MTDDLDQPQIPKRPRDVEAAFASRLRDKGWSREARQLSQGKTGEQIAHEAAEAEAARTEKFRDHFERLAIVSLYLVWGGISLVALTWLYHLVAPPCWPRLPEDQVKNIQAVVTGGVIAGIAGGHMKKRLNQ